MLTLSIDNHVSDVEYELSGFDAWAVVLTCKICESRRRDHACNDYARCSDDAFRSGAVVDYMKFVEQVRMSSIALIESYERRITTITDIMRDTVRIIEDDCSKVCDLLIDVSSGFKEAGIFTQKEVQSVFDALTERNNDIYRELDSAFTTMVRCEQDLLSVLKKVAQSGNVNIYRVVKDGLLPIQKGREKVVSSFLLEINAEQELLNASLRSVLQNKNGLKVNDVLRVVDSLMCVQRAKDKGVEVVLFEFCSAAEAVESRWVEVFKLCGSDGGTAH